MFVLFVVVSHPAFVRAFLFAMFTKKDYEELKSIDFDSIPIIPDYKGEISGVYALYLKGELLYIGASKNVIQRINRHRYTLNFDAYKIILTSLYGAFVLERILLENNITVLNRDMISFWNEKQAKESILYCETHKLRLSELLDFLESIESPFTKEDIFNKIDGKLLLSITKDLTHLTRTGKLLQININRMKAKYIIL